MSESRDMHAISVVIPAYNAAAFLRETLESVFAQTLPPQETIVVDDASTDATPSIVKELAAGAPIPVKLIRLPRNSGTPAEPMNVGIDAARAECIALLDHDDLMLPENLACKAACLDQHAGIELILSDYEVMAEDGNCRKPVLPWTRESADGACEDGRPMRVLDPADCQVELMARNRLGVSCSNYFFRKSVWQRLGGFSKAAGVATDLDFLLRAISVPIAWLDAVLFRKREHRANLWRPSVPNILDCLRVRQRWLDEQSAGRALDRMRELRRLSVTDTREWAWEMYWRRQWEAWHELRHALRDYADIPEIQRLLAFKPYPRWMYPLRDSAERLWSKCFGCRSARQSPSPGRIAPACDRSKGMRTIP